MAPAEERAHPASYRDPAGFIFEHGGDIYRQVNRTYQPHYELFLSSGLYDTLTSANQLLSHTVVPSPLAEDDACYLTLKPERVGFISYPYEWTFDMLRDAALLTLSIAATALAHGMVLKDASPYNVQWHKGRMTFIDTLSFEQWKSTQPWIAYRQFCENFLAPLALMHYTGLPLQQLLLAYPEGLPVAHAVRLLPWKSRWNLHLYLNLHLHARYAGTKDGKKGEATFSSRKMQDLLRSLREGIESLSLKHAGTWSAYYEEAETRTGYLDAKREVIERWLQLLPHVRTAVDTGANDGRFTELFFEKGIFTIAADGDHGAVNTLYRRAKKDANPNVMPLLIDFTSPSPALGFNNLERDSFLKRVQADLVVSLAFIHHLAIAKNVPFARIAALYAGLGRMLLIEFISRDDEKVTRMLSQKSHTCDWYAEAGFLQCFAKHYVILETAPLSPTRTLYLMQPHENAPG